MQEDRMDLPEPTSIASFDAGGMRLRGAMGRVVAAVVRKEQFHGPSQLVSVQRRFWRKVSRPRATVGRLAASAIGHDHSHHQPGII